MSSQLKTFSYKCPVCEFSTKVHEKEEDWHIRHDCPVCILPTTQEPARLVRRTGKVDQNGFPEIEYTGETVLLSTGDRRIKMARL